MFLTLQVDDKVNFHFIMFNNVDGHLYELGTYHSIFGIQCIFMCFFQVECFLQYWCMTFRVSGMAVTGCSHWDTYPPVGPGGCPPLTDIDETHSWQDL